MRTDPNLLPPDQKPRQSMISDEDMILLESLVKSPVFGALKRVLALYEATAMSELKTASDTHKLFQTQGRLIGIESVKNVGLLVQDWQRRQNLQQVQSAEKEKKERRLRTQDPRPPNR